MQPTDREKWLAAGGWKEGGQGGVARLPRAVPIAAWSAGLFTAAYFKWVETGVCESCLCKLGGSLFKTKFIET